MARNGHPVWLLGDPLTTFLQILPWQSAHLE